MKEWKLYVLDLITKFIALESILECLSSLKAFHCKRHILLMLFIIQSVIFMRRCLNTYETVGNCLRIIKYFLFNNSPYLKKELSLKKSLKLIFLVSRCFPNIKITLKYHNLEKNSMLDEIKIIS